MADDELEAIRRQRMAELQAKHGVRTKHELGSVFAPALYGDAPHLQLSVLLASVAKSVTTTQPNCHCLVELQPNCDCV